MGSESCVTKISRGMVRTSLDPGGLNLLMIGWGVGVFFLGGGVVCVGVGGGGC
jgi:hypothetical protein